MRYQRLLLLALAVFASVSTGCTRASTGLPEEYEIFLHTSGGETAEFELKLDGNMAWAKSGDLIEVFDLKNQRWQDNESKKWVTLTQCESWAQQSKEKSSKSTATVSEDIRPFVQWILDPKFDIASSEDTLTLNSGQVDYTISVEKTNRDLASYYRYAKLNAYKKAMTEQKLPPFAELKVLGELERRQLLPTTMEIEIPGVPGAPSFTIVMRTKER